MIIILLLTVLVFLLFLLYSFVSTYNSAPYYRLYYKIMEIIITLHFTILLYLLLLLYSRPYPVFIIYMIIILLLSFFSLLFFPSFLWNYLYYYNSPYYIIIYICTYIYWKEIKIKCKISNMTNWAQKLEDRLCISSVLWLVPYFGFFSGVDRWMDERTP